MNKTKQLKSKRKGSAMALTLIGLIVLLIMGVGLLSMGLRSRILALQDASDIAARSAADAGLTKAVFEMNERLKVKPWSDSNLPQATHETLPNCDSTFSYTTSVDGSGVYSIEVTGDYGRAQKEVSSTLQLKSVFDYGIFVDSVMVLKNGTTIDGYNYDAGETLKIGTNNTGGAAITAKLGVTIDGDVVVGVDSSPDDVIDNVHEAVITGDVYSMSQENELPSILVPQYLQDLPSQGVLTNPTTISGDTKYDSINLGAGSIATIDGDVTLYVAGDLILDNSAELQIADPNINPNASLTIYLGGNLVAQNGGGINNEAMDATKLKIFALDTCTDMDFKNSGVFYGAIYAPNASVHLYNSVEMFGSVICNSFYQDVNADFHFDAALRDGTTNEEGMTFVVDRWSE
ncbi:MAG: DUF7305 domain-containing protein [Planctomycetota bacterium]|jgi:hypothetical protein